MLRNTSQYYGWLAKWLHWVSALLVVVMLLLGYLTTLLKSPGALFFYHKSIGMTLLIILLFRLIWRFSNPQPRVLNIPHAQTMIAKTVHYLLYLSIFVLIFAGWGMSSWGGHSVPFWGKTNWALPVAVNLNISHSLQAVHYWGAWALFTLIILHLIAALYHQLILRDNLISTMWRQKTRRLFK